MSSPDDEGRKSKRRRNHQAAGRFAETSAVADQAPARPVPTADALLLRLANACLEHQTNNHGNNKKKRNDSASTNDDEDDFDNNDSSPCRKSLESLAKIFLKLEDTYRASQSPSLENVKHLCDFYGNICRGGFCPHAPKLLDRGRRGTQVMPRVHALMEHLVTKSVMANQAVVPVSSASSASTSTDTSNSSLHETLVHTITALLLLIPEASLQQTIVQSLTNLLLDATTVLSVYLSKNKPVPVQLNVSLFPSNNSAIHSDNAAAATASITVPASATTTFRVSIRSMEQAQAWQASMFHLLALYLRRLKQVRATSLHHHATLVIPKDECGAFIGQILQPSVVATCLRMIEWTTTTTTAMSNAATEKKGRVLSIHCKMYALQLLSSLLAVLASECSKPRLQSQVASVVAKAARAYFQLQSDDSLLLLLFHESSSREVARLLTRLLIKTILLLPNGREESVNVGLQELPNAAAMSTQLVRRTVWPIVLEAVASSPVGLITAHGEEAQRKTLQVNDQGKLLPSENDEQVRLVNVCLAILYQGVLLDNAFAGSLFLSESFASPPLSSSASNVLNNSLVQKFMQWLSDPRLGHLACGIVAASLDSGRVVLVEAQVKVRLATTPNSLGNGDESYPTSNMSGSDKKRMRVDAMTPGKRQKTATTSSVTASESATVGDSLVAGSMEDELVTFFMETARPAATRICAMTLDTLSSDCIMDVVAVSSAIRLLVPHVNLAERETDPHSMAALLSFFVESMIAFCNLLKTCTSSCLTCISICIDCGAYVASHAGRHPLFGVLAKQARTLALIASWTPTLEPVGALVTSPFSPEGTLAFSVANGAPSSSSVQLFPGMALLLKWNYHSSELSHKLVIESLHGPITTDPGLQQERLMCMQLGTGSSDHSNGELSSHLLQQRTIAWITATEGQKHENPCIRMLWWQSLAWLVLSVEPTTLSLLFPALASRQGLVNSLLTVALGDSCTAVREYVSREAGKVLLASHGGALSALLLERSEMERLAARLDNTVPDGSIKQITETLFQEVDRLLHNYASVPQALLSYTARPSSAKRQTKTPVSSPREVLACQRVAVRVLASLCSAVQSPTNGCVMSLLENAFRRIVSISGDESNLESLQSRGICHGELSLVRTHVNLPRMLKPLLESVAPEVFYNLLVPFSGFEIEPNRTSIAIESIPTARREQRHRLLWCMMDRFVMQKSLVEQTFLPAFGPDILRFIEDVLPSVMSLFVTEREYDGMRLATEFKSFVMQVCRNDERIRVKPEVYDGKSADMLIGSLSLRKSLKKLRGAGLDDATRRLCLADNYVGRILASVFIKGGQTELVFLLKVALQNKISLPTIANEREQVILQALLWQLGLPHLSDRAAKAFRIAALAKRQENHSVMFSTPTEPPFSSSDSESIVTDSVSSHFMSLMVNVIQNRWNSKTKSERMQSLRCLSILLGHLHHDDAAQYIPQVMSTVNRAIANDEEAGRTELTLEAIEVLSRFVKLTARNHWELLGQNLAVIVVSLIPVLTTTCSDADTRSRRPSFADRACHAAAALLEWLTQGELGKKLADHFSQIPFLPTTEALDGVLANLRLVGVDFDFLLTSAAEGMQNVHRSSMTSDGSMNGERLVDLTRRQEALRHRLEIMRPLLHSENASLRKVSLQHVTTLLQANRELFHLLIENEGTASMGRYLTVAYDERGRSRGVVVDLIETLLSRCADETDSDTRQQLGVCLGEVGAIDSNRLDETRTSASRGVSSSSLTIKRLHPPWKSSAAQYEFDLVTTDLVLGLKSAVTSTEQNKIAYTIQQLLNLLDAQLCDGSSPSVHRDQTQAAKGSERKKMNPKLSSKLAHAGVLDLVGKFWYSEYRETGDKSGVKQPPFFKSSRSYSSWIANWCRYMIVNAKTGNPTAWTDLFSACELVTRSHGGASVAETLLPLLVLDRLCSRESKDEAMIVDELTSALNFDVVSQMDLSDRQKAVNTVFSLIERLEQWFEGETERKHAPRGRDSSKKENDNSNNGWPRDPTLIRIEDLLKFVPLSLRARAAARVGMYAGALRILEIAARKTCASVVFDSSQNNDKVVISKRSRAAGTCPAEDMNLMKDVLAELYDYDTMSSLVDDHVRLDPQQRLRDNIRLKEAACDWEGALLEHEHAQHICGPEQVFRLGSLKCLLELGHFESVLNQVTSLDSFTVNAATSPTVEANAAYPFAVEAAWRLGRWEKLNELCMDGPPNVFNKPEARFQASMGSIMLGIKKRDPNHVRLELDGARNALMLGLSSAAKESYSRSYDLIVHLQSLREIEDSYELLCSDDAARLDGHSLSWNWHRRLDVLSSNGASVVIKTRLALSRLASDKAMEASLFLDLGIRARKSSLYGLAASSFAQAETALLSTSARTNATMERFLLLMQSAKLKYACGEIGGALRLLQLGDEEKLAGGPAQSLQRAAVRYVDHLLDTAERTLTESEMIDMYTRSLLQSTVWLIDGALKDSGQIRDRFTVLHRLAPKFEKGHFQYAKYVDSLLEARIEAIRRAKPEKFLGLDEEQVRSRCLGQDRACHRNVLVAIQHYIETLKLDTRHVYQALPRLLSLWFDFTSLSIADEGVGDHSFSGSSKRSQAQTDSRALLMAQEETNALVAREYKMIPPRAFYTAIPQLVSRVTHDSKDTEKLVRVILTRVLSKHPEQAMWLLGWLRQSQLQERKEIGDELFQQAEQNLLKMGGVQNTHRHKLLVESKSLFLYFHNLAIHKLTDSHAQRMNIKPWKGGVSLGDFVPPVQAALSISFLSAYSGAYRESFPRQVPRMRTFSPDVSVMGSKARPKKLKVFVVSADTHRSLASLSNKSERESVDIGEIHFLVKQEAKGDLRKDARVQDLNNVVNRLMVASTVGKGAPKSHRRLSVRTYAVTCLSEDTGILEWVPETAPLRNLISASYNPQASPFSAKRRGARAASFGDPMLRTNYEKKCQALFFEHGDLRRAATLFEELCLRPYPPLLYWWFVQHFPDPHAWYEARTKFTLSAAMWSGVGHVIGLGDRHSENILVDTSSGECVHVDFDCIFDKGLSLPKPEAVPFRLTHNMVDAFGPTGVDGVFTRSLNSTMSVLRNNHDTLLSVLEPFVKDPIIDWRRLRSQQKNKDKQASSSTTKSDPRQSQEAKRSLLVIDQRLKGIYNLRNPNLLKIRSTSDLRGGSSNQDDDLTHLVPLSVDGQVHKMISEATSSENLVQLYVGWMPWL